MTRRKNESRLERVSVALRAYSKINHALIQSATEDELLRSVAEILNEAGDYGLVWIGVAEDNPQRTVRIVVAAGAAQGYVRELPLSWEAGPLGMGPVGRCLRGEGICVSQDFLHDPNCAPWRNLAKTYDLHAAVCFPLSFDDATRAVLTVYRRRRPGFAAAEIKLLAKLAEDVAFGVRSLRRRRKEEIAREARRHMEEQTQHAGKTESVGRLSGAIAHEFNNLLTIISGQTELLSMDLKGKQLDRAQKVRSSVRRAADLTRQLSSFSQQKRHPRRETDLRVLLDGLSPELQRLLKNGVRLTCQSCPEPWSVRIDHVQVEYIIKLMVASAMDAMPGGGNLSVIVANCSLPGDPDIPEECVPAGRYTMLCITDTGNGVYPGLRTRLVEPVFRPTPLERSMGLTLTMIHEVVHENAGILCLRSTPESGTCIRIYFPALAPAEETAPEGKIANMEQVLKQLPTRSALIN